MLLKPGMGDFANQIDANPVFLCLRASGSHGGGKRRRLTVAHRYGVARLHAECARPEHSSHCSRESGSRGASPSRSTP